MSITEGSLIPFRIVIEGRADGIFLGSVIDDAIRATPRDGTCDVQLGKASRWSDD